MYEKSTDQGNAYLQTPVSAQMGPHGHVTAELIRKRAYEIYVARGAGGGHEVEDWLQAERELKDAMFEIHCPTCEETR